MFQLQNITAPLFRKGGLAAAMLLSATHTWAAEDGDWATSFVQGLFDMPAARYFDLLLSLIAVLLLFAIYSLAKTYIRLANSYGQTQRHTRNQKLLGIGMLTLMASSVMAQAPAVAAAAVNTGSTGTGFGTHTWALALTVLVEAIVAFAINRSIVKMMKAQEPVDAVAAAAEQVTAKAKSGISGWWERINNFVPIEKEKDLDTGHSYDGIRELDNVTPTWFTTAFVISILFALFYLYRYHIAKSAPLQLEEFQKEVVAAERQQAAFLRSQGNNIDETNVVLLGKEDIAAGKALFDVNCVACHKADGGGSVGPNLTDDYWLHGGGVKDIFKIIKYGFIEKGMKSWKDDFSPKQMAQLTSYVHSLHGTNPAGAKEPQGEKYVATADESAAPADSTATTVPAADTTAVPK